MKAPLFVLEFEKPLAELARKLDELRQQSIETSQDLSQEITAAEEAIEDLQRSIHSSLTPWQRVQIARHTKRPHSLEYVGIVFEGFQELHGDRQFNDDRALVGGFAFFEGEAVMVIAQQKGLGTKEQIARNFGMPHPEGYRKALRIMRLAEKFGLPLFTFIDTPGAYPGIGSEERHVSEAIAVNLREMSLLRVPSISVVVGEGGSGGALGIGVTDRMIILENSYYSVISPEGCAAILWKDGAAAGQAASALKLSAHNLKELGVVDEVIAEPLGGAHLDPESTAAALKAALGRHLKELRALSVDKLLQSRYDRYRTLGVYDEAGTVRS